MDRNLEALYILHEGFLSLSARRAWIEIALANDNYWSIIVALRKESVDRNRVHGAKLDKQGVALRKESVDRNSYGQGINATRQGVALRKESVDRN